MPAEVQEAPSEVIEKAIKNMSDKQQERKYFLGELKERVLRFITLDQVTAKEISSEIISAIEDPRATHMLIHHSVPVAQGDKYEKPAKQKGLEVTYVSDPSFTGPVGLLVASDEAADV